VQRRALARRREKAEGENRNGDETKREVHRALFSERRSSSRSDISKRAVALCAGNRNRSSRMRESNFRL
jgi:hypothetical protein